MTQSPAVSDLVKKASTVPLAELPLLFDGWSQRWPYPRGDLNNWIEPLDRFDTILHAFITKYGLHHGPQTVPFGNSILLEGSPGYDEKRLKELGFGPEGDRQLIEAILVFSRLLVEKCANRTVYNSTDRLNDLLNTTSLSLLHSTLRLTIFLAQRYSERTRPSHQLATKFYDYDHDRLQRLAAPIVQPHSASGKRAPPSPVKTTKSKEKSSSSSQQPTRLRRGSTVINPNDFRSLCRDMAAPSGPGKSTAAPDREWQAWAHVKVVWYPEPSASKAHAGDASSLTSSDSPSTPTPFRRPHQQPSPALNRPDAVDTSHVIAGQKAAGGSEESAGLKVIEVAPNDISDVASIHHILRSAPADMPSDARYELLHKLRTAYGLVHSASSRRELLAIRLLAVTSLANVFSEAELPQKLFPPVAGSPPSKPQELIQQIVSLIQDTKKGHAPVSFYLQTLGMETMGVLARHKVFASDINAALGASSSHGLLARLTEKGLADIAKDGDSTDTVVGDDWREAIFSMPRVVIEAGGHHGRSSEAVIASSFITTYLSGFSVTTAKALRVHLRMLDFIKTFFHHFKDGLATLLGSHTFEVISNLLGNLTHDAWTQLQAGNGIPSRFKTRATDYEIPYMHQQIIRSIIDMINDISGHQGAQADRVLRSLVDSPALLGAFRLITDHLQAFGAHTWGEVVKAVCGFLHNEPTSYTIISEAGIIQSLLATVTGSKPQPADSSSGGGGDVRRGQPKSISSAPQHQPQGIPPAVDAVINVSQVFGAICLTNAGFDLFNSSGALEKFFELFESPAHVKVLKDPNTLALLGSTFDELVRHHPDLRASVLSAATVMLARVRHIGRSLAWQNGAGPKLWLTREENELHVCGGVEQLSLEVIPPPSLGPTGLPLAPKPIDLPNGDQLILIDQPPRVSVIDGVPSDQDQHGLTVVDYVRPAIVFFLNFLENQSLCSNFLELGGGDILLDFITIPSLPVGEQAFGPTGFFHDLASIIHMMAEVKPHLVLPVLADRARFACNELKHFVECQPRDATCYFAPVVEVQGKPEDASTQPSHNLSPVEANGTRVVKSLMAIYCLTQVLAEVFNLPLYNTRSSQNFLFGQVNLADIFAEVCRMLGGISAACYREEIALQRAIPNSWLTATKPEHFSTGDDEVDRILSVWDGHSRSGDAGHHVEAEKNEKASSSSTTSEKDGLSRDRQSPSFKNVQILRYLLNETPASVTEFLCRLGRGIAGRRRPETFSKQKTALVADALAAAYITQLQPYFLNSSENHTANVVVDMPARFSYLVVALANVRGSFYDDHHASGPRPSRQTFVVDAFRRAGGIKCLTRIGTEFFDELKSCKVEHSIFSANTGLKICLDILDEFTSAQSIVESAQSSNLKNPDPTRPFYFVPAQVLLELRMEALPLTRLIWESEYADQASKDVVQKLVSILRHVLTGDQEGEAVPSDNRHPTIAPFVPRKFTIDAQKVNLLKERGYDEELAREALYRCNLHTPGITTAEEYCKALLANPQRRRLPIPNTDADSPASARETPGTSTPLPTLTSAGAATFGGLPSGPIEAALAEVVNNGPEDNEMEDATATTATNGQSSDPGRNTSSAMDISNILNENGHSTPPAGPSDRLERPTPVRYSVESINAERKMIRLDLADRCNNVLNNHQSLTFELSDLIVSATKKLDEDSAKEYWKTTLDLLVTSLLSMQPEEEMTESRGKKIAAAAHLIALLIQDNDVFKETLDTFRDSFEGLLPFLQLPSSTGPHPDESYPWVAPMLLIIERMLSRDSEPAEVKWDPPPDLESTSAAILTDVSVFDINNKRQLFEVVINLLPRVGKDKSMALSLARVLVILTRNREMASLLAERRNLQRLFVMIKQLANGVSGRLQGAFMIILRHIVEDQETLKQIMRSEIIAALTGRNPARPLDVTSYIRELYHLVLRSPETFIEVSNEMVKLATWLPHATAVNLVLKEAPQSNEDGEEKEQASSDNAAPAEMQPATSVEGSAEDRQESVRAKSADIKPPVVEHPDGVIHFILSELLAYKDVEDKEPSIEAPLAGSRPNETDIGSSGTPGSRRASETTPELSPLPKPDKARFKPEDHPIFIYRCFLLQTLSELLYSYNRTKVEFINFSRKADPLAVTPAKPRSGILNYLLTALVPSGYVDKDDSWQCKKKVTTSDWAIRVLVALCSKTGEMGLSGPTQRYSSQPQVDDIDNEPDLAFVRRFVLEHAIKAFKDGASSTEPLQSKYSRLLCLSDMFNRLLTKPSAPDGSAGSHNTSYKVLGRMMFEKNLISVLTTSLAEIDLSYSGAKRVIKFILRPLQELTNMASQLSLTSPDLISPVVGNVSDDVISSASSVSEVDNEREETPDLFRNSALGLLGNVDDRSDDESPEEEEDEEMYDDGYVDEMEYDDGMVVGPNDDEAVSDEEVDDRVAPEGPIEGLPGDVPMDIEFVVNDPHMEVDTEEDDDDDEDQDESEDDDDDEEEEDEDGEDFMIEDDEGEIDGANNHDENDSLVGGGEHGHEDEGEWEDEDDEEEDDEEDGSSEDQDVHREIAFEGEDISLPPNNGTGTPADLNNLLRALGDHDMDGSVGIPTHVPATESRGPAGEDDEQDEDEEDEEEGDEMDDEDEDDDENGEDMEYGDFTFDQFLARGDDLLGHGEPLGWDDLPSFIRRHRQARGPGPMTSFLGRRLGPGNEFHQLARPGRVSRHTRPGGDDGTNPLLQRPQLDLGRNARVDGVTHHIVFPPGAGESGFPPGFPPLGATFQTIIQEGDEMGGHGAMLDAILQALHRGERDFLRNGRLQFSMTAPLSEIREVLRPSMPGMGHRHHAREESPRAPSFTPALTVTRWQEEVRMLFGNSYLEKIQRVQTLLLSLLVPPAQREEKIRRQKHDEDRAEREEMERLKAEAERRKKEEEEREAAAKAEEEERARAEAEATAAAAAARGPAEPVAGEHGHGDDTEPMEDVQTAEGTQAAQASAENVTSTGGETEPESTPRVFTTIRGRPIDITGLAIDVEYLEALPEDLREEVIMQQYATRREEAQQEGGDANAGIDPEFLNALPEDIREEIRQQEAHAQRRREREAARRQAAATGGPPQAEEMDNDNFLATLDPALRRAILAEQPPEILQQLDPRHAAEGRAHARRLFQYAGIPVDRDGRDGRARQEAAAARDKRQAVQLVDKAGVATLLRLMFLPQHGSLKSNLNSILRSVCDNRHTRFEVINMLLVILKEGSTDVNAVERSLASLSLRAKATASQKTPQPLKRTLSMPSPSGGISEDVTPLVVVQQCLSALKNLSQNGYHVKTIFLREVDVSTNSRSRKGKTKEGKTTTTTKYPINDLIGLLDRRLIMENSSSLQSLSELLRAVTSPLAILLRKDKEKPSEVEKSGDERDDRRRRQESPAGDDHQTQSDAVSNETADQTQGDEHDLSMMEAPPPPSDDLAIENRGVEQISTSDNQAEPIAESSGPAHEEGMNNDDNPDDDAKTRKAFEPPIISEHNLKLIVSIFVAPECNSETFHATLETLSNLSYIPGTSAIFSRELIDHIKNLSHSICGDLDELLPLLREAQSSTDLHAISSSKFSHGGSDQVKLLRVLQALDYLSAPKKDSEEAEENAAVKSILTSSYEHLSLGPLWSKLSECLTTIREKEDNIISFANILLPLIESLLVVCKNTSLKDAPFARQVREQAAASPAPEGMSDLEELFFNFTTEHRKILNDIIRQSPKLMQGNGSFSLLVKNPKVLDFDNKRAYFTKQIHSRLHQQRHVQPPLQLNVRRDQVFLDSYKALYFKSAEEMKYGKLNIRFNGEEGVDAGGVTREWFQVLARGMFNPDWALWQPVAADRTTFHPNPLSWINGEHLLYFKFIGRIIGKALHEGRVLDCHFSRAVYKRLLGKEPNLKDLESMDLDYYKSLVWILENDITDIITEDFSVIEEQFGEEKVVDLIPNGRNIPVTEENKREYVNAQVRYRLTTSVKDQLDNFIRGFHDIIPAELVAIFDEQELELLISGLPEIDVDDWRANTEYHNYTTNSPQVTWFWRIVRGMNNEERAKLLQFVTGTSKVPLNGFKDLEGMQGTTRFSIHRDPSQNRLPTSHTCFNRKSFTSSTHCHVN